MMNINGLRVYARIMATGTLAAASKSLNKSESSTSRQLSILESVLGMKLFTRDKRRLIPTLEGEAFYHEAERILDSIEQIPAIAQKIKNGPSHKIQIILMPRMAPTIAVPAIHAFTEKNPRIDISIEVQQRMFLERWVATQQFDLGIGALPTRHTAIESETLCDVPPVVLLQHDHPLASRKSLRAEELVDEHFIMMPANSLIGRQTARIFDESEIMPSSRIQVSQSVTCCYFVARGAGIAIHDPMIPSVFNDNIKKIPLQTSLRMRFGLIYPRGVKRSQEVKDLSIIIKQHADEYVSNLNMN